MPVREKSTKKYLWKSKIKERGWTDGAIKKTILDPQV